jgi:hypothetical protein
VKPPVEVGYGGGLYPDLAKKEATTAYIVDIFPLTYKATSSLFPIH